MDHLRGHVFQDIANRERIFEAQHKRMDLTIHYRTRHPATTRKAIVDDVSLPFPVGNIVHKTELILHAFGITKSGFIEYRQTRVDGRSNNVNWRPVEVVVWRFLMSFATVLKSVVVHVSENGATS